MSCPIDSLDGALRELQSNFGQTTRPRLVREHTRKGRGPKPAPFAYC